MSHRKEADPNRQADVITFPQKLGQLLVPGSTDLHQILKLLLGEVEAVHKCGRHGCAGAGWRKRAIIHLGRMECPQTLHWTDGFRLHHLAPQQSGEQVCASVKTLIGARTAATTVPSVPASSVLAEAC